MLKLLLFFFYFLLYINAFAQIIIPPASPLILNTSGGTGLVSGSYIIDWSVGEATLIDTYFARNGSPSNQVGAFGTSQVVFYNLTINFISQLGPHGFPKKLLYILYRQLVLLPSTFNLSPLVN